MKPHILHFVLFALLWFTGGCDDSATCSIDVTLRPGETTTVSVNHKVTDGDVEFCDASAKNASEITASILNVKQNGTSTCRAQVELVAAKSVTAEETRISVSFSYEYRDENDEVQSDRGKEVICVTSD